MTTELTTTPVAPAVNMLMDGNSFGQLQRVATMFAASQLVPQHLRGKVADCAIALYMAHRLNEDPLTVMQNIVIVNGKAGWMTQYMIGRTNRSGVFKGRINWRTEKLKDDTKVTAFATLADTGEEVSAEVSMSMAKAEGWTKNAKYASMPEHMLKWRAAAMLVRLYAPEVMMGIPAADEIQSTVIEHKGTPSATAQLDSFEAAVREDVQSDTAATTAETINAETGEVTETQAAPAPSATDALDQFEAA